MKNINIKKYYQNEFLPLLLLILFFLSFGLGPILINLSIFLMIMYLCLNFSSIKLEILDKILIILGIYLLFISLLNTNYFLNHFLFTKFLFLTLSMKIILKKISENYLKKFIKICSIFLIFLVIDLFYQKIFKVDIFGFKIPELGGRLTGPFNKLIPGTLVLYLGFYFFFYFYIIFLKENIILKNLTSLIFLCFFTIAILITGERMNFISSFFAVFLITFFTDRKKLHLSFMIISFLLCLFIIKNDKNLFPRYETFLLALKPELNHRNFNKSEIENFKNKENISVINDKVKLNDEIKLSFLDTTWGAHYLSAFQLFKNKPFFGNGIKSFRDLCKNTIINSVRKDMRCSTHPHNIHLELLAEIGIVGYFIFIMLILIVFYKSIKIICKKNNFNKQTIFLLFGASFILCATLLFPIKSSGRLSSTFFGSLFWLNFSILYSLIHIINKNLKIKS